MSTILDVERRSGVSKSTISRYLQGKTVTPANQKKIESAIAELDYRVNPLASGLKTNRTKVVGILIPDITDPFFPPIVKRLERKLREKGYHTLINNYGKDWRLEKQQLDVLLNQRVDGLVIASSAPTGEHISECYSKVPTVMIDRIPEGACGDSITVDNFQATKDALALAVRKGHRRIAIIRGEKDVYSDIVRYRAYREALEVAGIPFRPEYEVRAEMLEYDACRQFMRLLTLPEPPTLIFCTNVYIAAGGLEAVIENKLDIPREVSVLAFDRLSSFPYYNFLKGIQPEFASICQPLELIATKTAELLLRRMEEGTLDYLPEHIELKTSFVMTDSIQDLTKL